MSNIPLIDRPDFLHEMAELKLHNNLDAEQFDMIKRYREDGYLIIDINPAENIIRNIISTLSGKYDETEKNPRVVNAWKTNSYVNRLAINNTIMDTLRLLYQREPIPFQTLNFDRGTEQRTHSDMIHFNSIPQRFMCGVWVALEDINDNNGPLHYYPGSHKLPFYDYEAIGIKGSEKDMSNYKLKYEVFIQKVIEGNNLKKETLHIKKGQAIIWSANLLHGGEPIIKAGSTRHSQVTHYFFENCAYYTPMLSDPAIGKMYYLDITNIKTGKKVPNLYFGKTLKINPTQQLKGRITKALSHVSHLFPKSMVKRAKDILGK